MKDNLINFNELTLIEKYNVLKLGQLYIEQINYTSYRDILYNGKCKIIKYENCELKFDIKFDSPKGLNIYIIDIYILTDNNVKYVDFKNIPPSIKIKNLNTKLNQLKRLIKIDKILK